MRTFKMFLLRWKSIIRKPYAWAFIVIAVATSLVPVLSSRFESKTALPLGLVNEDGGSLSLELEDYMKDFHGDITVYKTDRAKALRFLAMGRLEAVYVINAGFSDTLARGECTGVITLFTAPASSAAQTLSEAVINSALTVWMEEKGMLELSAFLSERGLPFPEADQQALHDKFGDVLDGGNTVHMLSHVPAPPAAADRNNTFLASSAWYAAFSSLFVIVSAGWVIETRRLSLGERMRSAGIHPYSAYAGSALCIIVLSMLGWFVSQIIVSVMMRAELLMSLRLVLPMLLYMAGLMGLTVTISSLTSKTVQLMLVAPVFAITQGVLCGMLLELPAWAGTLNYLADALPGRWFVLGGDALLSGGNTLFILGQALCALAWLALGMLFVTLRSRQGRQTRRNAPVTAR